MALSASAAQQLGKHGLPEWLTLAGWPQLMMQLLRGPVPHQMTSKAVYTPGVKCDAVVFQKPFDFLKAM